MLRRQTTMKFDRLMMLRHIALAACLATTGCGGGDASGAPQTDTGSKVEPAGPDPVVPTPTPTPTPTGVTKSNVGINLVGTSYYSGERHFANLLSGSQWSLGGTDIDPSRLSSDGAPLALAATEEATIPLTPPTAQTLGQDVTIRCTYSGTGSFDVRGRASAYQNVTASGFEFLWKGGKDNAVYLGVKYPKPSDPLRNLDCRDVGMDRGLLFDPDFVESVKPFGSLRFMDWQNTNANLPITWETRRLPGSLSQVGRDGVAIEHMVDLSNQANSDPWFSIPWNADDAYVRNFAILVRDRLLKDRKVYVELSNEVWNYGFLVTHQAVAEGEARNLSPENKWYGALYRYSQKSAEVLKIWTEVFAAEPHRLVRVVSTQHFSNEGAESVLGFPGTAQYVDALATAPYFGHALFEGARAQERNLDVLFPALAASAKSAISLEGTRNKAVADKYKKRFIAYEAGQHIVKPDDIAIMQLLNRDPRMYEIYHQYLADWQALTGDTMALYNSTSGIGKYGAWGIREYSGQPLSETPKRRAVLDYIAGK